MNPYDYALAKCAEIPHQRGKSRHYCVITTKRNKIVGEGRNDYVKTHVMAAKASKKVGKEGKECIHSELKALLSDRYRKGYKLTVVRLDANGNPCYSEPCVVCKQIIKEFSNIRVVEYSI